MPFAYKFVGDSPRSLPAFGIDIVSPGETVETVYELNHPDFKPVKKAEVKAVEKAEAPAEPVKEKK